MPILSNAPVTVDGKTYDRLAVNLAVSPVWKDDDLGPALAIRLTRYRKGDAGVIDRLDEGDLSIVHSAQVRNDPAIEAKVRELMSVVQDLVNLKGL
tara:strand:+ start:436 stop:723 length:288 start_codon:yes stop_codon:yes gene_type:complete